MERWPDTGCMLRHRPNAQLARTASRGNSGGRGELRFRREHREFNRPGRTANETSRHLGYGQISLPRGTALLHRDLHGRHSLGDGRRGAPGEARAKPEGRRAAVPDKSGCGVSADREDLAPRDRGRDHVHAGSHNAAHERLLHRRNGRRGDQEPDQSRSRSSINHVGARDFEGVEDILSAQRGRIEAGSSALRRAGTMLPHHPPNLVGKLGHLLARP